METTELYRTQFTPVILGTNKRSRRTARRLFWQYGLSSHVFDVRFPLFFRAMPWLVCHKLTSSMASDLTLLVLTDLADEIESTDHTPLLYLCTENLSEQIIATLTSHYILCDETTDPIATKGATS